MVRRSEGKIEQLMQSQDFPGCEFVKYRQFSSFTLQKQAILQKMQIFFATSGLTEVANDLKINKEVRC